MLSLHGVVHCLEKVSSSKVVVDMQHPFYLLIGSNMDFHKVVNDIKIEYSALQLPTQEYSISDQGDLFMLLHIFFIP